MKIVEVFWTTDGLGLRDESATIMVVRTMTSVIRVAIIDPVLTPFLVFMIIVVRLHQY